MTKTKAKTAKPTGSYKAWRERNPDKANESTKRWIANNRERWNEYCREYRKAHPEMASESSKKYRENNAEKVKAARAARWQQIKADPLLHARELELQRMRREKRKTANIDK